MSTTFQNDETAEPGQALAVIEPTTILRPAVGPLVPALIAAEGESASLRFIDFFTANIRNPNTRAAYAVAVRGFFAGSRSTRRPSSRAVRTHHVSAYVEVLTRTLQAADGQAAPGGDPHAVRLADRRPGRRPEPRRRRARPEARRQERQDAGARRRRGATSCSTASTSRTVVGLRDRALIALLIYSFARISAALHMNVEDYYPQGKRWWVRLHEKGGKQHEMPAHHLLESYIDAYVTARRHRRRQDLAAVPHARRPRSQAAHGRSAWPAGRAAHDRAPRACRPGSSRSSAVTRSARPASPSTCSTAACSNTRSRWRRMRARARPSSTTAATIRSRSIKWRGSSFDRAMARPQ